MGQKDEKQEVSDKSKQKINRGGMFSRADVRGYARMRKAMLEREKRLGSQQDIVQNTEKQNH